MNDIKIGILAGMGPRSTSPFVEMVLDECQRQYGAKYDIDYPHMLIYSLPTPFYIDREVNEVELSKSIKEGLESLAATGVDIIAIPCNSAHKYFDDITRNIDVPVLHIVDETLKNIDGGSKVTILATELTMKTELYQQGIECSGCEFVFMNGWQQLVNSLIKEIKASGDSEDAKGIWNTLSGEIKEAGIENIILACTDLNVVIQDHNSEANIIDSSVALAKELVARYLNMK